MTALYDSTKADVITLTARPDLVNETDLAIRHATIRAHTVDFFPKDFMENAVQFDEARYLQSLDLSILTGHRATKYIRKSDINGNMGALLSPIDAEDIFTAYGKDRVDCYYPSGSTIQIKSCGLLQYAVIGYYALPITAQGNYNSWIAALYPEAIVAAAAALVLTGIGYDEQADRLTRIRVPDAYNQLRSLFLFQEAY